MQSLFRSTLAAVLLSSTLAHAQTRPQLPPPQATDPIALKLMQGFPPPPDKTVRLANVLQYPNARWAFHHMRELGPTAAVWRGAGTPSALPQAARDLDVIRFDDGGGQQVGLTDWQRDTYTDALLVLHRGRIVYERYAAGMQPQQPHALWSLSKSLTGLLAAQLIHEGRIDPSAPVTRYLPEVKDSAWGDATVQQTLDMTTSVQYDEDFARPGSGIFQYLIAGGLLPAPASYSGARSMLAYLPTVAKAGEHGAGFQYKTVDTEVIGWLLQRVTGQRLDELLSQRLWQPLGAGEDGYVWVDGSGAQLASVGVGATARDLSRLGEMLRLQGRFNGREVLAPAVVAELRKGGDVEKFKAAGQTMRAGYSYHDFWWIPHDADGSFEAKGLNGQHVHVNPAAELVVVKLSSHPVPNTAYTHVQDRRAFAAIAAALRETGKAP
ncbi:serine hydrolase [Paucibacter sp. PLA-PC-4]|uniref:serine hydrolase domain-containing protein n=1 Tax=Paucibacter sp. PLA-PC-4 TaxID=2993655 RepID=UPI00224B5F2B|nr:serine hydrolase [Paucibacter sp. PLA-PC-4]MCX2864126.1 serine hydrolase [Paucibacter sp. PLA-PC-4]